MNKIFSALTLIVLSTATAQADEKCYPKQFHNGIGKRCVTFQKTSENSIQITKIVDQVGNSFARDILFNTNNTNTGSNFNAVHEASFEKICKTLGYASFAEEFLGTHSINVRFETKELTESQMEDRYFRSWKNFDQGFQPTRFNCVEPLTTQSLAKSNPASTAPDRCIKRVGRTDCFSQ